MKNLKKNQPEIFFKKEVNTVLHICFQISMQSRITEVKISTKKEESLLINI